MEQNETIILNERKKYINLKRFKYCIIYAINKSKILNNYKGLKKTIKY